MNKTVIKEEVRENNRRLVAEMKMIKRLKIEGLKQKKQGMYLPEINIFQEVELWCLDQPLLRVLDFTMNEIKAIMGENECKAAPCINDELLTLQRCLNANKEVFDGVEQLF